MNNNNPTAVTFGQTFDQWLRNNTQMIQFGHQWIDGDDILTVNEAGEVAFRWKIEPGVETVNVYKNPEAFAKAFLAGAHKDEGSTRDQRV